MPIDPVTGNSNWIHLINKVFQEILIFAEFLRVGLIQELRRLPPNSRKIFFILDDDRLYRNEDGSGRYAYLTMNAFSLAGYNVYFYRKNTFFEFRRLRRYGRFIYSIKNLKFVSSIPEDTKDIILAFDNVHPEILRLKWKKSVYVNILKPALCSLGPLIWKPYYFHPLMYRFNQIDKIPSLRRQERKIRIFFGGSSTPFYYKNRNVCDHYGQMTRIEGIDALLEMGNNIHRVEDLNGFRKMLREEGYQNQCWILEVERCGPTEITEWFGLIARADFFMCFSGTDLPMCHNSIESMAVGTIPIISYADWFFPPLEYKKNAILYSGKEDLKRKINEVLLMERKEIEQMKVNVLDYYDRYLSNESFIRNFESLHENTCTMMLHPRLVCKPQEDQEGRDLLNRLANLLGQESMMENGAGKQ